MVLWLIVPSVEPSRGVRATITQDSEKEHLTSSGPLELLIEEARNRTRRRRLAVGFVALIAVVGGAIAVAGVGHSTPKSIVRRPPTPAPAPKPTLLEGTTFAPSTVTALSMLTPETGYGVSTTKWMSNSNQPLNSYLTSTGNYGNSWRVVAPLPQVVVGPITSFVSPLIGYVAGIGTTHLLLVTTDGGQTWRQSQVPGIPLTLTSVGSSVWVTTQLCTAVDRQITSNCPTSLSVFSAGAVTPTSAAVVPTNAALERRNTAIDGPTTPPTQAANLLAQFSPTSALVSEGLDGGQALMQTTTSGRSWQTVATPCDTNVPTLSFNSNLDMNIHVVT